MYNTGSSRRTRSSDDSHLAVIGGQYASARLDARGRHAVLPLRAPVAGLARRLELGLLLELLHDGVELLLARPVDVRAVRHDVALALAREAAVHVALLRLVVALERVEVVVRPRLLRVPRVVGLHLGLVAPDAVVLRVDDGAEIHGGRRRLHGGRAADDEALGSEDSGDHC